MARVSLDEAKPGMVLSKPITNDSGVIIVNQGIVLTEDHIERLKEMGITHIFVKGERKDRGSLDEALESLEKRFKVSEKKPYMDLIKRALQRHLRSIYGGSG